MNGSLTLNPQQCTGLVSILNRHNLWGEFAGVMGTSTTAQTRSININSRRNVRRARTTKTATTAHVGQAQKLLEWVKESGKPFTLKEASKGTGIPYNSVAKLAAGLIRAHNLQKQGRGVYQLGTA